MTLTGQQYSVLGLARSGLAAANALAERGADVIASDLRTAEALSDYLAQLHPAVDVRLGGNHYRPGDVVIVIAYGMMTVDEAKTFKPVILFPDTDTNQLV